MAEPRELVEARHRLAEAEADYRSAEGLLHLGEGLALLDDVIGAGDARHRRTAQNLASSYAARIYGRIKELLDAHRALPEPELEHCFKLALAFDRVGARLPNAATALKIEVVRQLIERYYEGHPLDSKRRALQELERIARRE
jgi:hypothetical protein